MFLFVERGKCGVEGAALEDRQRLVAIPLSLNQVINHALHLLFELPIWQLTLKELGVVDVQIREQRFQLLLEERIELVDVEGTRGVVLGWSH